MRIIDAHAHIFPEKIADRACGAISDFYGGVPMDCRGTAETLLAAGQTIGVEQYVVFSTATKPEQVESINSFIIDQCAKHPEFIGLGTMHQAYADFACELDRIQGAGLPGIKLHPDFQKVQIDDRRLFPIFDILSSLGMFLLTHAGDARYDYSHPARIARVAKEFPRLRIIAAHFGGWSQWDAAMQYLDLPNVYFDTSSTLPFDGRNMARRMLDTMDPARFFFGTDFPMWNHEEELARLAGLGLPEAILENILGNNFIAFLRA